MTLGREADQMTRATAHWLLLTAPVLLAHICSQFGHAANAKLFTLVPIGTLCGART